MTAIDNYEDPDEAAAALEQRIAARGNGDEGQADELDLLGGARPLGDWLLDAPPGTPAVWGRGDEVLWPEGESLIVAGGIGAGKTTIVGQLVFARLGLLDDVLGYPVTPTASRVLVLAMDRPRQIQRALARLARPEDRDELNARSIVRPGPPPRDLARHPEALATMANLAGADTVILDSLKDAALGLSDDEVGAGLNRAFQIALAEGIEVAASHHQRKGQNGTKPKTLEDLYGSTWIPAGAGSVVLLWGKPGEAEVELTHLKPPAETIGPLTIEHDQIAGRSRVSAGFNLRHYLAIQPRPVPAEAVAHAKHGREPTKKEIHAARQWLDRRAKKGEIARIEGDPPTSGGRPTVLFALVDKRYGEPS